MAPKHVLLKSFSFSQSHIWTQIVCLSKKLTLLLKYVFLSCSREVFSCPVSVKSGQPHMCVLVQSTFALARLLSRALSLAMPLHVTVLAVSGETVLEMMMPSHGTVSTLKSRLHASTNVKRAEQVLILASRSLEDSNVMEDLVWWFVLSDLMGEESGEFVFELSLTMVVLPKLCGYCREPAQPKCGRCKSVRYCNRMCQRLGWPAHSKSCK